MAEVTATTNIEDLFDTERLPSGLYLLPFFFYFPLGLAICLIRIFIGLQTFLASCILPKTATIRSYVLRTMCFVLGIVVQEGEVKHKNRSAKVIVTNHVTMLDHLAVDLVFPCTTPSVWDLPLILSWVLGFKDLGVRQGREVLVQNVKKHCQESEIPILAHPEGATTNGRRGLLKFSTWPFSINVPVSPVVVEVKRLSLLNVSTSVLGSRWWSDIFWFLFSPCTIFKIRYLPEMNSQEDDTVEDFTRRVQEAMAKALGVTTTFFTCADKVEHLKRSLRSNEMNDSGSSNGNMKTLDDSHLQLLLLKVKEVLPNVPADVIKEDLVRTKNVNTTISNILEGVVTYIPEAEPSAEGCANPQANTSSNGKSEEDCATASGIPDFYSNLCVAASSFGRTANERMLSYSERKQRLIDNARRQYIQKHGLHYVS